MIALSDFKKGQAVFVVKTTARRTAEGSTAIVRSVGRKYVTLDEPWARQFYVNSPADDCLFEKTDFGGAARLYLSEEAFLQREEKIGLIRTIYHTFSFPYSVRLSLDQLRRINEILQEEPLMPDASNRPAKKSQAGI